MLCLLLIHLINYARILFQIIKLDKPHASTKCIVLWINPASTQCTYGVVVKLFCRFPSCE
jgi:hypothetical protein